MISCVLHSDHSPPHTERRPLSARVLCRARRPRPPHPLPRALPSESHTFHRSRPPRPIHHPFSILVRLTAPHPAAAAASTPTPPPPPPPPALSEESSLQPPPSAFYITKTMRSCRDTLGLGLLLGCCCTGRLVAGRPPLHMPLPMRLVCRSTRSRPQISCMGYLVHFLTSHHGLANF
jgi:hypothetical protein